jgi:putative phosphonate metabolism protein
MTVRYALYFAPEAAHPLWTAGCDWLGRDPGSGATSAGGPHREDPRRYGLHATLKPPFALRDGATRPQLMAALSHFVDERTPFAMPALGVATLGDFVALRPIERDTPALRALADDCVRLFDDFRRPPSPAERVRRLAGPLDEQQRGNVDRWGYPHVFEHWRFHMTLSDSLPDETLRATLQADAARHFAAALAEPLRCEGIALFVEDEPGADFRLLRRFEFAR